MKTQWQIYQELELIPDSVSPPVVPNSALIRWLTSKWQVFCNGLAIQPKIDRPSDFLDQCFALECTPPDKPSGWKKFWEVLNHPIGGSSSTYREPKIEKILDQEGHPWWQAYDPLSGQTTYLSSEHEVQIWLEERLYF